MGAINDHLPPRKRYRAKQGKNDKNDKNDKQKSWRELGAAARR